MILSRNQILIAIAVFTYATSVVAQLWSGHDRERPPLMVPRPPAAAEVAAPPPQQLPMPVIAPSGPPSAPVVERAPAIQERAYAMRPVASPEPNEEPAAPSRAPDPNAVPEYSPVQFWMSRGDGAAEGHLRNLSDHPLPVIIREENRYSRETQETTVTLEPHGTHTFGSGDGLPLLPHDRISAVCPPMLARTSFVP